MNSNEMFSLLDDYLCDGYEECNECDTCEECKAHRIVLHSHRVYKMCLDFVYKGAMKSKESIQLLLIASIYHDIAKLDYNKHQKKRNVKSACKEIGIVLPPKAYAIIAAHKGKFNPDPDIALAAAILRICDKLDKFYKAGYKRKEKAKKKAKKDAYKKTMESLGIIVVYFLGSGNRDDRIKINRFLRIFMTLFQKIRV